MNRIMIAGTESGAGKTTVVCAILSALKKMNKDIISFKCGPDYIDPMFHKKITGIDSRNLDLFLMGEEGVKYSLINHSRDKDIAVIEGVMGLYDGIGKSSSASSNNLALVTKTPTILVVNGKGKSVSICAQIKGYLDFEENNIEGIILNNISKGMFSFYKEMIESKLGIDVIGFLPNIEEAKIGSRHLGLITADEIRDLEKKVDVLGKSALENIDMGWIMNKAKMAADLYSNFSYPDGNKLCANIYVSRDNAFCFYYEDNHDILKSYGANIKFFSPLWDREIPDDADGLILWGGYPENYASQLSLNKSMLRSIKEKICKGMPVYAECGGFMYLQEKIRDHQGEVFHMVGALDGESQMTTRLQNFGYVELMAKDDNMLCGYGEKIRAHSFHHSKSTMEGKSFIARKQSRINEYSCIVANDNIFAGYPHIHFFSNMSFLKNFIRKCEKYRETNII